jgi:hypothetical protein
MLPTKFWFIWLSSFRRQDYKNRPIRNKNCLWWPCLLMDRDKMSNLYRGPSIDASYQVSVHRAEGCQRRRLKCEKLTDDRWQKTYDRWQTTDDGRQVRAKAHSFGILKLFTIICCHDLISFISLQLLNTWVAYCECVLIHSSGATEFTPII